jgi:DNA-binding transcriptional ArsR family regulator
MSIHALAWALTVETGSPTRKAVLLALADRYNENESAAWPSVGWIARATELHPSTVRRAIADLLAAELLEASGWAGIRSDRMTKRYRLKMAPVIHRTAHKEPSTGSPSATSSESRGRTPHPRGRTPLATGSQSATRTISEPLENRVPQAVRNQIRGEIQELREKLK